ncbi:MAG: DUF4922 domain-containing protein [Muribaculaceae bacterium]|nr:DUF4922 domain-containing protein [Muribaculaceae bacterium]
MRRLNTENINDFIERQLLSWPGAKRNYDRLRDIRRKSFGNWDLNVSAQLNPERIRSTGAAVDAHSLAERPCFLCKGNRPTEQLEREWPEKGWFLLVNPYPILPVHFTIVSSTHRPQSEIPLEMATMAENAPDLVIFYNGARAGASAPDHAHCQAMLKSELPLIDLCERFHPSDQPGWKCSEELNANLPFHFLSAVINPDIEGMRNLAKVMKAYGVDAETRKKDPGLVNAFFWVSDSDGKLRIAIVPRKAHRPSLYHLPDEERFVISPGAVDMAGLLIVPREQDFNRLDAEIVKRIYAETAFSDALPEELIAHFKS